LEQTDPTSNLKQQGCRKDSFEQLTQFSQGKNVLDAPVSKTDGFLGRHMCFFNSAELGYLEKIRFPPT
jgi:hypothetical protein